MTAAGWVFCVLQVAFDAYVLFSLVSLWGRDRDRDRWVRRPLR